VQSTLGHGNIATTSGYLHARPNTSGGLHLDPEPGGQVLSWVSEFIDFRLTTPRRGRMPVFDTAELNAADQADLHHLRRQTRQILANWNHCRALRPMQG
jgi:hypothetical protein